MSDTHAGQRLLGAAEALRKVRPGQCCEPFLMRAHAAPLGWVTHSCSKPEGHTETQHECECGYTWTGAAQ